MASLYNIDYLKHLCQKYGLVPSKKYGQNFLISPEPIEAMIEAAEISDDDTVVEVGPGFGALTFALAAKAKKVIAFEIEKKLESYWNEQMTRHQNIEIIWGNVLSPPLTKRGQVELPETALGSKTSATPLTSPLGNGGMTTRYKVIANLPYQITSEVIRKFLEAENKPELMVLMVQKEVAERICAVAGDMSVLAVSVQLYAEPEIIMNVPRSSFWPQPKVDSAIIKIRIKNNELGINNDDAQFFKIVKAGFANRRKMLIKNLEVIVGKQNKEKLKTAFHELEINEKVRAQELSVEQWRELTRNLEIKN